MPQLTLAQGIMAGGALLAHSSANKARRSAEREASRARAERAQEREKMEARMKKYEDTEYIPIDVEAYQQENVYEDLTVDTTAAEFAVKSFGQQQANIMENLRGVAGASGAASLAQGLSVGAEKQSRQVQLTLGQQMQQNRKMQMMEESRLQEQDRSLRLADAEGRRRFEIGKMETLMGVQGAQTYGANQAYAQSQTNLMNIQGQQMQLYGQTMNMFGKMDWSALGGSCFAEGDEVEMFDGTMKAIELVKIGDEVKSIKDNKITKGVVTNTLIHPTNDVVEVIKINGITAEPYHPVFINNKWVPIKVLGEISSKFIDNWYNLEIQSEQNSLDTSFIIGGLIVSGLGNDCQKLLKFSDKRINQSIKQI